MRKGASELKVLVGGDPISAEGKGSNGDFCMFGTFNAVMTCNSRLRVRLEDDAGAWLRRLLIIRYENPPPAPGHAGLGGAEGEAGTGWGGQPGRRAEVKLSCRV
jgi:hypothetical protein